MVWETRCTLAPGEFDGRKCKANEVALIFESSEGNFVGCVCPAGRYPCPAPSLGRCCSNVTCKKGWAPGPPASEQGVRFKRARGPAKGTCQPRCGVREGVFTRVCVCLCVCITDFQRRNLNVLAADSIIFKVRAALRAWYFLPEWHETICLE